jgi:hypothetical protein
VAIYDVMDDPRIQYPKEAQKEGIKPKTGGALCPPMISTARNVKKILV